MERSHHVRNRTVRPVAVAIAVAACFLSAITPGAAAQDDDPVRIVASFSVLADIVQQIGGDHVEVTTLVPVGGDAHLFDPAPDQVVAIAEADLIIEVGGDFEPWLDDLVDASGTDATRFEAFGANDEAVHDDEGEQEDHDADHADEDAHGDEDDGHDHGDEVHRWLNVDETIDAASGLAEILAAIDPDNADAYAASGEAYIAELEELDRYIMEQSETIPADQRQLITVHQSFGAFADRYGYGIPGVLLESQSTEGADASAGHVAELAGIIDERGIPVVFPDTPGGDAMLAPLADAAGVEIAPQLYVETLGEEGSGAESYIDMMRHNIDTIVAALAG